MGPPLQPAAPAAAMGADQSTSTPSSTSSSFTRLCVKNVPKHVDERRLRAHFASQGGQVTDAKLLRTKAGQPRKMAFVGFRSEAEARAALRYFHGTFLDTSRLVVEAALPRGATALPRPWSRHSQGSSRFEAAQQKQQQPTQKPMQGDTDKAKKRKRVAGGEGEAEGDGQAAEGSSKEQQQQQQQKQRRVGKEEFLATMMPRSRTQFWANDDAGGAVVEEDEKGMGDAAIAASESEDEDEGGSGSGSGSGEEEEEEENVEGGDAMDEDEDEDADGQSAASSLPEPEPSGLDFLRSKVKKGLEKDIDAGPAAAAAEAEEGSEDEDEDEEESDSGSDSASGSDSSGSSEDEEDQQQGSEHQQQQEEDGPAAAAAAAAAAEADADAEAPSPPPPLPPSLLPSVEETGRLFIRNLPFSATEEDVTAALEAFGQVSEVHMPLDDSKRPKGFAFATFVLPEDAKRAMEALDGQAFQGRLLHVLPAKEPPRDPLADLDPSQARTYKERKEIERRQRAGDERGWNASFLRGETVVDAVADRLGLAKGQVLDREGEGMAVKLALGETFLLAENREFFRKEGVDLSVLEGAAATAASAAAGGKGQKGAAKPAPVVRSKTTILVKNLPYSTSQEDLQRLFGRFGALGRVLLPPSRAVGLVDFLEAGDARRAFKGLAYKRYQHVPLYLEWAPLNTFTTEAAAALPALPDTDAAAQSQQPAAPAAPAPTTTTTTRAPAAVEQQQEEEVVGEGSFTLFVKNLNFATTDEGLAAFFKARTQGVRAVNIPKKTAPAAAGAKGGKPPQQAQQQQQQLSMGYGFVEYASPAAAKAALRAADGQLLDGHKLQCKLSDKRLTARPTPSSKAGGGPAKRTKLVVRNLAFQANVREIKELFSAFGKLKTVRLPKKFDGSHRGFAFVEFLTAQEAGSAFAALASTHLYGRHLVLEWAEDKDDLEALREKAQKDARKGAAGRLSSDGPAPGGAGGKKGKKAKGGFDGDEDF